MAPDSTMTRLLDSNSFVDKTTEGQAPSPQQAPFSQTGHVAASAIAVGPPAPMAAPYQTVNLTQPLQVRRLRVSGGRPDSDPAVSRESQGRRLQEARLNTGYRTASDAARDLKIAGPTYLAHENGTRQIRPDIAAFYARNFNISADWLLFGTGHSSNVAELQSEPARQMPVPGAPPAAGEPAGLARLLLALKVSRAANGGFVRQDALDGPGQLLPIALSDGYVAELAQSHGDPLECMVALSRGAEPDALALRDVWRIPMESIERGRLFVVRMPGNLLLKDMPGGQRALIDPDDIEVHDEGLFMGSIGPRGLLVPMYVSRSEEPGQLRIARSLAKPPVLMADADVHLVGRIVNNMDLKPVGEAEVQAVADHLQAVA